MKKIKLKCQYSSIQVFHGFCLLKKQTKWTKYCFSSQGFSYKNLQKKRRIYSQNSPFQGKSKTKLVLLVVIFDRLYFENGQNL